MSTPLAWMEQAACVGFDTELFFPEAGQAPQVELAKAICADCPVANECLRHGLNEHYGIFGRTTPRQRQKLRVAAKAPSKCEHGRWMSDRCGKCGRRRGEPVQKQLTGFDLMAPTVVRKSVIPRSAYGGKGGPLNHIVSEETIEAVIELRDTVAKILKEASVEQT